MVFDVDNKGNLIIGDKKFFEGCKVFIGKLKGISVVGNNVVLDPNAGNMDYVVAKQLKKKIVAGLISATVEKVAPVKNVKVADSDDTETFSGIKL
jgi:hypothetical protein